MNSFWHGFLKKASTDPLQLWLAEAEEESKAAPKKKQEHNRRVDPADQGEMQTHDAFYRY